MRHGKAGVSLPSSPRADSARGLTEAGVRDVRRIAAGLGRAGIAFGYVASSPLARALQTAEIVASAASAAPEPGAGGRKRAKKTSAPPPHSWNELRPEAAPEDALGRIAEIGFGRSALLVGHEPNMTVLMGRIISGRAAEPPMVNLKKGGMARLRILSIAPEARGELRWLATPRQLGCLQ